MTTLKDAVLCMAFANAAAVAAKAGEAQTQAVLARSCNDVYYANYEAFD